MVSCVVTAAPAGVTVAGLKAHVAPAGRPEQAKLTAESNPFSGVTVSVTAPSKVEVAVTESGEALSVNAGAGAMV
jgi:hypothetical protein